MTPEPGKARLAPMTTVEDIEKAVTELPIDQFARFRAWFEDFDAARLDDKIEQDVAAGKLEQLADRALATEVDDGLLWFWIGSHADCDDII